MPADPFELLGLAPGASAAEVRAARRRLAKRLHPDAGGDVREMQALNDAAAAALATRTRSAVESVLVTEVVFEVDALPVVACLALLRALDALGEVLDADEPYRIDARLDDPACLLTLELVPEAGGSIVTLTTDGASAREALDVLTDVL